MGKGIVGNVLDMPWTHPNVLKLGRQDVLSGHLVFCGQVTCPGHVFTSQACVPQQHAIVQKRYAASGIVTKIKTTLICLFDSNVQK